MSIKSNKAQLQELLYCQLENLNAVQNLLQVMEVQQELLFKLNKQSGKNKKESKKRD